MQRKRPEDRSKTWNCYRRTRLYLDDIDKIFRVVSSVDPQASAETEDFKEIHSAQDLKDTGLDVVDRLEIATTDGRLNISIGRHKARIRIASADDNELVGALSRLRPLISEARSNELAFNLFVTLILGVLAFLFFGIGAAFDGADWTVLLAMFWLGATVLLYNDLTDIRAINLVVPRVKIINAFRSEAPSFWDKNAAPIVIGFFVNVVTGAIFFFIGKRYG